MICIRCRPTWYPAAASRLGHVLAERRALRQAPASSGSLEVTILAPISPLGAVPTPTHSVTDAHETSSRSASTVVFLHARLPPVGSVVPGGGLTVTVFASVPVAVGLMVPVSVRVLLWPLARLIPVQAQLLLL